MESSEGLEPDDERVHDLSDYEWEASESDMTMDELKEALEDESHPRHIEAVEINKDLADKLAPLLAKLRESVIGPRTKAIQEMVKASQISTPKFEPPVMPAVAQARAMEDFARGQQAQMEEFHESMRKTQKAKAERLHRDDERSERTLAVLESMDANLRQLNMRIESVDTQIQKGNASGDRSFRWTLTVGVLTLIATMVGVGVTIWLS